MGPAGAAVLAGLEGPPAGAPPAPGTRTAALARPAVAEVLLAALSRGNGAPGSGPRSPARRGGGSGTRTRPSDCDRHGVGPGPDAVGGGRGELGSYPRGRRRGQGRRKDGGHLGTIGAAGPGSRPGARWCVDLGVALPSAGLGFLHWPPGGLGPPLSAFLQRASGSGWVAAAGEGFAEKLESGWERALPVPGGSGGEGKEGIPDLGIPVNGSFQKGHAGCCWGTGRRRACLLQRSSVGDEAGAGGTGGRGVPRQVTARLAAGGLEGLRLDIPAFRVAGCRKGQVYC